MKGIKSVALLTAALLLSFSSVASASPIVEQELPVDKRAFKRTIDSTIPIIVGAPDNGEVTAYESLVLPTVRHTGKSAYTGKFSCNPKNGKTLNIAVANSGSSTVYMTIYENGSAFISDYPIAAGATRVQPFISQINAGIGGDWEIYIYNKDGSDYDLSVKARQF